MLTAEQIIPFLNHTDTEVRRLAVENLTSGFDSGPATAEDLWRSIDQYGCEESVPCLNALARLKQTEISFRRLMTALNEPADFSSRHYFLNAICALDWDLFEAHQDEILAMDNLPPGIRRHFLRRLTRDKASFDELWKRLEAHGWKHDLQALNEFSARSRGRLMEVMVRRYPAETAERAMDALIKGPNTPWIDVFSFELLGRLRHRQAIPLMFQRVTDGDSDAIAGAADDALVAMADAEIVTTYETMYRNSGWEGRMMIAAPLGKIRLAENEAAILRLLEIEKANDLATFLAGDLCSICANRSSLEIVRKMIVEDRYDPDISDLQVELLPAATMVGYEPPEANQWRQDGARLQARYDRRVEEFVDILRNANAPEDLVGPIAALTNSVAPELIEPIRRQGPKVGRNDPCPCGSGKKYKKCCLGRE